MERGQPVRILFVIDQFIDPYAGTEGQLLQLVSSLPVDQFRPELLVFHSSDYIEKGMFPCKAHVLGVSKLFSVTTWISMFRFARLKKKEGVALCHIFFNDASVICPPVFSSVGIPTLISRRDMGYWYTKKYLLALRQTGRWVAGVVANSEAVKSVAVTREGYATDDVTVIYNGYPGENGTSNSEIRGKTARQSLRSSLGFSDSHQVIVLVANLRPIKRINDAIEALNCLLPQHEKVHLVIVGGGCAKPYQKQAEHLGISDNVHFLGARNDVKNLLSAMDAGILCSQSEGYSNAIVEYMQAGLPVVASSAGGNVEAVVHGETGYLYPVGDIQALAGCLSKLLIEDKSRAMDMGRRGRDLAVKRHGLENMVNAHCDLYEQVLAKKRLGRAVDQ